MSGWRQAVFVRQRRIDVIQRALSKILDAESWSPVTPRRLHVGDAEASSRGWTMICTELANFFLDRGGLSTPRLCRLARELRCPAYEVDVRDGAATTLFEVDPLGRMRISGAAIFDFTGGDEHRGPAKQSGNEIVVTGIEIAHREIGFSLLPVTDDMADRIAALDDGFAVADYHGALAGFPAWTQHDDNFAEAIVYEPPKITVRPQPETRAASERSRQRAVPLAHDRRGRRPRSAARPRR